MTIVRGTILNTTTAGVLVDGSNGGFSYGGSINNSNGHTVVVQNRSRGTVTFSGTLTGSGTGILVQNNNITGAPKTINFLGSTVSTKTLNTGANPAVTLNNNTGATVNFTGGGLDIDTTSGSGLSATGGGTVIVTGANNTIDSTTGTALNVANTTIGTGGLTFQRISANGAVNGIVLNNTGSTVGLTVTGNGGNCTAADPTCTGGTIQATTGTAVVLSNTRNVSLIRVRLLNAGGEGVTGTGVATFIFSDGLNVGSGDADNEDAFDFAALSSTNITGALTISNSAIHQFTNDGLVVRNITGTLAINLTNNTFFDNDGTFGVNAVLIEGLSAANVTLNATGNTFDKIEGEAIQYEAEGAGTNDVNIIGNTMTHPNSLGNFEIGGGVTLVTDNGALLTFDVQGNYLNNIADDAIVVVGEGNAQGRIGGDVAANQSGPGAAGQGNTIKQSGSSNGCAGDGIRLDFDGNFNATYADSGPADTWTVLVKNNFIDQHNGVDTAGDLCAGASGDQGFVIFNRDHPGVLNVTVDSNTVTDSLNQGLRAFVADREGAVTNGPNARLAVTNNSFSNITSAEAISMSSDDLADICTNIAGNTKSGGGAPDGNIFLDRRVTGAVFEVPQASTAAIGTANNNATVTLGPVALTFGATCTVPLPTNG